MAGEFRHSQRETAVSRTDLQEHGLRADERTQGDDAVGDATAPFVVGDLARELWMI